MDIEGGAAAMRSSVVGRPVSGAASQEWTAEKPSVNIETVSSSHSLSYAMQVNGVLQKFIDPREFDYGSSEFYQFADLRVTNSSVTAADLNAMVSSTSNGRAGVFVGQGAAILGAAQKAGINEVYLFGHMMTETLWGTSAMAKGKYFEAGTATIKVDGRYLSKEVPAGTYYNFIGWGAYDSKPETAYDFSRYYGWDRIEDALYGAAEKLGQFYIYAGQPTVYDMRWNPAYLDAYGIKGHQYATDPKWGITIAQIMGQGYKVAGISPVCTFRVPQYLG